MANLQVRNISDDLHDRLRRHARENNCTISAEVVSVLRRGVLSGRLEEARARMVIADLTHWPVDRISHRSLAALAWQQHRNVSAYEAFYVAAARARGLPLLTADGRLARASGLGIVVQSVRTG